MSLSVNPATKVITVPQAYLSNLGGGVYGLDLEQMHYDLRAWEAGEIGVPMDYTHDHNPEVTLSGAVYSRFIIFVNGYTVTFEDGQYAVNATGANSNIADVMNVNQVSLRTFNSAGLITVVQGSGVTAQDILDIADQVWDETLGDHLGGGSTGAKLNEGATVDADTIADAVWDEVTADHIADGTYGHELATKADIAAATSTSSTTATSGSVVYGTQTVGTYASVTTRDNSYWQITESAADGITAELTYYLPDNERAGVFDVFGRYSGTPAGTHYIELWAYNYEATAWEILNEEFMPGGITSDDEYTHEFFERNIDRTNNNEVQIRLIHNVTTYNASHNLYLDYAALTSIEVITAADIADAVWDEPMADHLTAGTTGEKLNAGGIDSATIEAIVDAVWDELLSEHQIDGSAGEYLYIAGRMAPEGGWMSSSTASEIKLVRDKLGDAGNLIAETIIDEEGIASTSSTVFTMYQMIFEVNGVWLRSDTGHTGTNYYTGDNGAFDSHTGQITLHTSLPSDNEEVLISYTYFKGLHDDMISQFLTEAKMYVKKYTRKDYTWSEAFADPADEETQIALWAATALAAKRCLEALAAGDILQLGFNFRLGDLEIENMVRGGGFQVQAHIDMLNEDIEKKLAMLGRGMYFSARSTKLFGRDHWGYRRTGTAGTRRSDVQ